MKRQPDSVVFVGGARESGKSSWLKQYARGFRRVVVWDVNDEYAAVFGVRPARSPGELVEQTLAAQPIVVFVPDDDSFFPFFCKVVWLRWRNCLLLVDELSDVTTIAKARSYWGKLVRRGRHHHVCIAAGAQRPAEVDKTLIGNLSRLVCFRLAFESDSIMVGRRLRLDPRVLEDLPSLHFYDADLRAKSVKPGVIVFA